MRVGIVGAGSMGEAHAAGWRATDARLVGFVSQGHASAERLAERHGARAYRTLDELLSDVDVVDLCVPSDLHHPMTLEAAAAGVHVVCEKPIALGLVQGREMIEACQRAGVRLFVAMVVRFFPQYRSAAQLIADGAIGDLGVLRLKRVSYPPRAGEQSWFDDAQRSGGMIVDLMIHDFDYAASLAGEVTRVHTRTAVRPEGELADYALVTLRFASGAMALLEGGWVYPPGLFRVGFDLAGTEGVIEWDSDSSEPVRRFLSDSNANAAAVGLPLGGLEEDPYTGQIRHVHQALESGDPFAVTPEEALAALRVALAAKESLRTGRAVAPSEVA
ncbi:MAG: Gfo/Idh/MocA family oxidoreductase [Trueperaceae bacterium]